MREPVERLFAELRTAGVRYALTHGYTPSGDVVDEGDIDIYVEPSGRRDCRRVLERLGWLQPKLSSRGPVEYFYEFPNSSDGQIEKVHLLAEVSFPQNYRLAISEYGWILDNTEWHYGLRVPPPSAALLLLALRLLLNRKAIADRHRTFAAGLLKQIESGSSDDDAFVARFGPETRDFAMRAGQQIQAGTLDQLLDIQPQVVALECVERVGVAERNFRSTQRLWARVRGRLERAVGVRGKIDVALVGPDGAGKSTIAMLLVRRLTGASVAYGYFGHKDHVTGTAGLLEEIGLERNVRGRLARILYALWWPFEVAARRRVAFKRATICICDRHPTLDQCNSYPGFLRSSWLRLLKWYDRFAVGKPHLVIIFDGEPEVIWKRKQECTFEDHVTKRARYLRHLGSPNAFEAFVVRSDCALEETYSAVVQQLLSAKSFRRLLYR